MAGISEGRYKDFLLQEIMVLGLERRWSAVDTYRTKRPGKGQRDGFMHFAILGFVVMTW